jgi:threonine aldolase
MKKLASRMLYTNITSTRSLLADFRSDTVTQPTAAMLSYMSQAAVGDDVFEEDPTILELQRRVSQLTGKEAALFCATGTLSNQLAIRTHLTQPPYSVLCDVEGHVHRYESGGISFHNGAQVIPIQSQKHLTLEEIQRFWILEEDVHTCPTKLICLENTKHGMIFPLKEQSRISQAAKEHGIRMHLDGARLWNAHIATQNSIQELCEPFDSVSLCFSKGLGAPVGSVLVGTSW